MTHSANSQLRLIKVCRNCGATVRLVSLNGQLAWTHDATNYYTCHLNAFIVSGRPWRDYVVDENTWHLAEPQD